MRQCRFFLPLFITARLTKGIFKPNLSHQIRFLVSLLVVLLLANFHTALAAPGDVDPSFGGGDGIAYSPITVLDMGLQPDGKIILIGSNQLARLNADGSVDTSFGSSGVMTLSLCTGCTISDATVQPDGKVVVVGGSSTQNLIFTNRYNLDGTQEFAYSKTYSGTGGSGKAVTVLPDGTIISGGRSNYDNLALVKRASNGAYVSDMTTDTIHWVEDLDATADGDILALLDSSYSTSAFQFRRYTSGLSQAAAGSIVLYSGTFQADAKAIKSYPNGKILVAGVSRTNEVGVVRTLANGTADSTFDGDGKAFITAVGSSGGTKWGLAVQPDGKILVSGYSGVSTLFLLRLNANGSLDTTFSGDGKAFVSINPISYMPMALRTTGQIVIASGSYAAQVQGDPTNTLSWAATSYNIAEAGQLSVTVNLTPSAAQSVTVNYATANGTAQADQDFAAASGTLTFSAGETSKTFTIDILGDELYEGNETFSVNLANASGASLNGSSTTVTVSDDDAQPVFRLDAASYPVAEGNPTQVGVSLSRIYPVALSVNYATSNQSAAAPGDYTATSGTLTFQPGEIAKTIPVQTSDDTEVENDEVFRVSLSSPSAPAVLGLAIADVTITNDDQPLLVGFDQPSYSHTESGTALINVSLNQTSPITVTVGYSSGGGFQAIGGVDYMDVAGSLVFPPGETVRTFGIPILNDDLKEGLETVVLLLSNPSGMHLGRSTASLTILDNEGDSAFSSRIRKSDSSLAYRLARGEISVVIDGMDRDGTLAVAETSAPETAPAIPANFKAAGTYFEVTLTDDSGHKIGFDQAVVCFPYSDSAWQGLGIAEHQLQLLHYQNGSWVDITYFRDLVENQICGRTSSFSPFAIAAASVTNIGNAQIALTAGPLSILPAEISFDAVTLSGAASSVSGATTPWTVIDARGSGAGWSVTVSASNFLRIQDESGNLNPDPAGQEKTIPVAGFWIALDPTGISLVDGNVAPVSLLQGFSPLSAQPLAIARAVLEQGMGTFSLLPRFRLGIPPSTWAGNYLSVLTVTAVSTP